MRLDQAVSIQFSLSRRAAREAVRSGRVDVNGVAAEEPGLSVEPGASISLHAERPARRKVRTRLAVLFEDDDVLIVDKPAGLLTVPTEAREKDTLWTRAIAYLQHRYGGRPYAGIVHRLDKDTSGAIAFARNRAALHALQELFRRHAIDREYVALVRGSLPDRGTLDADLVRKAGLRRTVARAGEEGQRAVTRYEAVERYPGATYVRIRPETGRTHQIRVHFAEAGHPVVGDRVYGPEGSEKEPVRRQLLHARRLGFSHPRTGEPFSVESPLPEDFSAALAYWRGKRSAPHREEEDAPHRHEKNAPPRRERDVSPRRKKNAPARPARSPSKRKSR